MVVPDSETDERTSHDRHRPTASSALLARYGTTRCIGQLRHARSCRSSAARAATSGTPTAALPRPPRRHRGQRARPRATRPSSRRSAAQVAHASGTSRTSSPPTAQVALAERLLAAAPAPPGRGLLRQLRRRGQRGRVQAGPARPGRDRTIVAAEGALPRPHHGRARAHRQAGEPRAVRAAARRRRPSSRTATSRRSRAAVDDDVAAVWSLEPIQGEAGVIVPPAGLPAAGPRAHDRGTARCWSLDEVQTGDRPHRRWFALPAAQGVVPDVVTLAKGLGGGCRSARCIAFGRGGRPARPRAARHHLRRQPARLRRRPRRARHDRARRPARARRRAWASSCATACCARTTRWSPSVRGARAAARRRAHRRRRRGRRRPRPPRPGFIVNAVQPTRSGSRRR